MTQPTIITATIQERIDHQNKAWVEALATAERANRAVQLAQINLDNAIHARDRAYEESTKAFNELMQIYKGTDNA